MSNPFFKFKKFTVYHDRCAMKVGTDGVLLGAWVHVDFKKRGLDIGTGSGLISLMIAQRNPDLKVDALEIDLEASKQAAENAENSVFANQISVKQDSFQSFAETTKSHYDLIVSNPPFFSQSLKSPWLKRTAARHNDGLSPEELFHFSKKILTPDGTLSLIYPIELFDQLIALGKEEQLFLSRICRVHPKRNTPAKRILLEFSTREVECVCTELTIEIERHVYTNQFHGLTKDFYLEK